MNLYEWEIWHTYTTFLRDARIDLEYAANHLVEAGIAQLAFHRDGLTVWREKQGIGRGRTLINPQKEGMEAQFELNLEKGPNFELEGFAREAWEQACHFRYSEMRLSGSDFPLPPPYVRAFLGQCNFVIEKEQHRLRVYPVLLLYESGVMIVEIRTISPDYEIPLEQFIDGAVNLFLKSFDVIEVPPGLSRLAPRAWYYSIQKWRIHQRAVLLYLERGHDIAVAERTIEYDEDDYSFELAPLSAPEGSSNFENLSSFALTVFHSTAFLLTKPHAGLSFIFKGQRRIPELGNFWSGRPHIYLIRFEGQQKIAMENEDLYGATFGSILARSYQSDPKIARQHLPNDSRLYPDYSAYIASQSSLWVWSLAGLEQQERASDLNRGKMIYEHQATIELLEYGYMLHRSLMELINSYSLSDEVYLARKALVDLEQSMTEASRFGEIRILLERGWDAMGLSSLKMRIKEVLSIKEAQSELREVRITARVGRALTILFGLIAIPSIANQVLRPIWKVLNIPYPSDEAEFSTILVGISILIVSSIILILLHPLKKWRDINVAKENRRY